MAAVASDRAMAQQPLHQFFKGRDHNIAVVVSSRRKEETELAQETTTQDSMEPKDEQGSATDIEEDPNLERRKRQRTGSPKEPQNEYIHKTPVENAPFDIRSQNETERGRSGQAPSDETYLAAGLDKGSSSAKVSEDDVSESRQASKPRTPSKSRMLRLRADGKLRSPSSTDNLEEPKARRKRRSGGRKEKHLVLKYGRMPHDRLVWGRKIEQIMSGKLRVAPDKSAKQKTTLASATPSSEPIRGESSGTPAKSTHPFFTGKVNRQQLKEGQELRSDRSEEQSGSESKRPSNILRPVKASWPASFGSSFSKPVRLPGSLEAVWPPAGMQHIRGDRSIQAMGFPQLHLAEPITKKLKGKERYISADEEVYKYQRDLVGLMKNQPAPEDDYFASNPDIFVPRRLLITGKELQERLLGQLVDPARRVSLEGQTSYLENPAQLSHLSSASHSLFNKIATSFSAFDTFDYDTQDWCHKYAPKRSTEVLQDQRELSSLRDWLLTLNVDNIDTGVPANSAKLDSKKQLAAKRRKRKIKEELDDFIVSSDEEAADSVDLPELENNDPSSTLGDIVQGCSTLKKLKHSNFSKTRAVLLSGPHGCGKSASIYAVAAELGFEVFEINSGTRRNGRDIMDRVGDMTRNHLVRNGVRPELEDPDFDQPVADEVIDEKQKSMTSFFKSKAAGKGQKNKKSGRENLPQSGQDGKPRKHQKQSLILLEEVDILFEEDKPFWSAVFSLIVQSRRPVVMTCTDEHSLPLSDFVDTSVMRLVPQSPGVISEYLLCLAANEGHLLSRAAVDSLVSARKTDLRGALTEMQFWCQMAVGDNKQGITWFMDATSANKKRESSEKLRIVSEATYRADNLLFERKQGRIRDLSYGTRLLSEAYVFNGLDSIETLGFCLETRPGESSQDDNLKDLRAMGTCFDALSAADTWIMSPRDVEQQDPSQPELSPACRSNYIDDFPLLQTDCLEEPSNTGLAIAFAIRAAAQRSFPSTMQPESRIRRKEIATLALERQILKPTSTSHTVAQNRQAFSSLSEPQEGTPWNPSRGAGISTFHGPFATIATEVAPVVRGIALYDIGLEEERKKLSELMDVPGRKGKRQRTTRASRAALEGGSKANTRRERWWSGDVDYKSILKTAGLGWTRSAIHGLEARGHQETASGNNDDLTPVASSPDSTGPGTGESADELA